MIIKVHDRTFKGELDGIAIDENISLENRGTMKIYFYNLIMLMALCSCGLSPTSVTATQTTRATAQEQVFVHEIPVWLRDPYVNVLMYKQQFTNPKDLYAAELYSTMLLNPLTGEKFTVNLDDGQIYEWIDNQTIGFSPIQDNRKCQSGMAYGYVLSLSTGVLLANDSGGYFCTIISPELIRVSTYGGGLEYFNEADWVEFIPALPGLYNEYGAVSPDETAMLVTQRNQSASEPNRIGIYDFPQKTEVGFLNVQNLNPIFEFVGEQHEIAYFEGNTPCILNWDALESECGLTLPEEYYNLELEYVDNDASRIGFVYPGVKSTEGGGRIFCFYDIFEGEILCPMKDLEIFRPVSFTSETMNGAQTSIRSSSVVHTLISPDEKFIYFTYQENYVAPVEQAVVSTDGETFFDLGILESNGSIRRSINENKWRPSP